MLIFINIIGGVCSCEVCAQTIQDGLHTQWVLEQTNITAYDQLETIRAHVSGGSWIIRPPDDILEEGAVGPPSVREVSSGINTSTCGSLSR